MKKLLYYACLLAMPLVFAACEENEKDAVLPAPEASMSRTFDFHTADAVEHAAYTLDAQESQFVLEDDKLEVTFAPARPDGKDALVFKIKKADLANGYVWRYRVKSLPDNEAGLAETTYYHFMDSGGGSALFSGGNTISGELVITSFDASTQLATGTFEVKTPDAFDPTRYNTNLADARKCDITVKGGFKNLRLVQL